MRLDLDGILEVTAVEKRTGLSRHVTIANALRPKSAEEIEAGRQRIRDLYRSREDVLEGEWGEPSGDDIAVESEPVAAAEQERDGMPSRASRHAVAVELVERSQRVLEQMHPDDREEAIELHDRIELAIAADDVEAIREASDALKELLFFVEGQI